MDLREQFGAILGLIGPFFHLIAQTMRRRSTPRSRLTSSSNQTVKSPRRRRPFVVFRPVANVVLLLLRVLVLAALGILHARNIPRPPP